MSTERKKYITFSIFDFLFKFGGTGAIIIYNYVSPDSTMGYKLSLSGIILFIALIFTAKATFEKHYRAKLDTMLQQLAESTDPEVKQVITQQINEHKTKNAIYEQLMLLLPFIVLTFVLTVAIKWLTDLRASVGLITSSMGVGSVFNILKRPARDKVKMENYVKKANK